jgi:hypothetical protein
MPQEQTTDPLGGRVIALALAVVHHGLSNFASDTVPAGWGTVIETARRFRDYINGNDNPQGNGNNRRR